ncbi:MAG: ComEC/Rec2 family competence protein [Candidatus Moraniibacteriota bacterium]
MAYSGKNTPDDSKMLFGFLISFIVAVFAELVFEFPIWGIYFVLAMSLAILPFGVKNRKMIFLFFCLLGIFLGLWKTAGELDKIFSIEKDSYEGLVYVSSQPEQKSDYQKVEFCPVAEETNLENRDKLAYPDCEKKFIYYAGMEENWRFGQVERVSCELERPENKYPKFNYIRYLAMNNIYAICQNLELREESDFLLAGFYKYKTKIFEYIFQTKKIFENKINGVFSFPESAYLAGLLLGGEDRLPEDVQEDFRQTGTTHTVAVSGFNITVLAGFFMWLGVLLGFWRQKAFWIAVLGIAFFVLMIGSPSSAVRAGIMGILILWASKRGRLAGSVRAIVLAGAIMVWFSPLILIYDAGFQLSFLAAASIVLVYEPLSQKVSIENDFLEWKSILLVTLSAQLGVLGILVYNFETFSPVSFLANLIILPAIPLIMLGGFVSVFVGFFSYFLASFIALPTKVALSLEIKAVEKLAEISWASVEIGNVGIWWVAGYYLFLALFISWLKRNRNEA